MYFSLVGVSYKMDLEQDKIGSIVTLLEGMVSSIEKFPHTSSCAQQLSTVATGRTVVSIFKISISKNYTSLTKYLMFMDFTNSLKQ